MEFEFAIHLQCTSFKWNPSHIRGSYTKFQPSTHVIVHCTYVAPLDCCLSIEVQPEQEAAPFVEDPDTEPRQQGKQTPLIMSIKSHFPLSPAYAMIRMITLLLILPHS